MGQKKRYQIKRKQKFVRKKARKKLAAKGATITDYYYGGFYLKTPSGAGS
jgi:hypothetical protein